MARNLVASSSQYLANTSASPVVSGDFTVCLRHRPTGSGNRTAFCLGKTGVADRHLLYVGPGGGGSGNGLAAFSGSGGTIAQAESTASLTNGEWHQIGALFGSSLRQTVINGALGPADTTSVPVGTFDQVYVGAYYAGSGLIAGFYGDGDSAELVMWRGFLTAGELLEHAEGASPLDIQRRRLVAYWPLLGRGDVERDRVRGLPLALAGPTQATHAMRLLPRRSRRRTVGEVVAASGFRPAWARGSNTVIGIMQ